MPNAWQKVRPGLAFLTLGLTLPVVFRRELEDPAVHVHNFTHLQDRPVHSNQGHK